MRLDEVTQLHEGLCLHFANGDVMHMEVGEAWDAIDKLNDGIARRSGALRAAAGEDWRPTRVSSKVVPLRRRK